MARLLEVLPMKLVALVAVPLVLGLVLLGLLVDLPPVAWGLLYLVVVGGLIVIGMIGTHVYLLEYQRGDVGDEP